MVHDAACVFFYSLSSPLNAGSWQTVIPLLLACADAEGTICQQDELIALLQARVRGLEEQFLSGVAEGGGIPASPPGGRGQLNYAALDGLPQASSPGLRTGGGGPSPMASRSLRDSRTVFLADSPSPPSSPGFALGGGSSSSVLSRPTSASPAARAVERQGSYLPQAVNNGGSSSSNRPMSAAIHRPDSSAGGRRPSDGTVTAMDLGRAAAASVGGAPSAWASGKPFSGMSAPRAPSVQPRDPTLMRESLTSVSDGSFPRQQAPSRPYSAALQGGGTSVIGGGGGSGQVPARPSTAVSRKTIVLLSSRTPSQSYGLDDMDEPGGWMPV